MPVAKSFQQSPILCEPYIKNGRKYVKIAIKAGEKEVRYYSDAEYAKMYPDEKREKSKDPYYKPQKYTLGFDKGYITIFKNVKPEHEEWFRQSICRFARYWGWYVISTEKVPDDLPEGIIPVRLNWAPIGNDEDWLVSEETVITYVQSVLFSPTGSKRQGNIGDRIERVLTVVNKIHFENRYGTVNVHIMQDKDKNYYSWKTSAKDWSVGTKRTVRGTIKEYELYENSDCTVLTRCISL